MILFTGLTGKSGSGLVNAMIKDHFPEKIRVVVRKTSNIDKIKNSGLDYEFVYGDIHDESFMTQAAEGCDVVFHIAAKASIGAVARAVSKTSSVKHCLMVSSTSIYSAYHSSSEKLKMAEKQMREAFESKGISYTIIRPTMIYGLGDKSISTFMRWLDRYPLFPIVDKGEALLQPVYKDDIGKAFYLLLTHRDEVKNQEFIISGDRAISLRECLRIISDSIGKKTKFINIPLPVAKELVQIAFHISRGKIDYREQLFRLTENRAFDHDGISNRFGFKPRPFEDGVAELARAYKAQKGS